MFNIFLDNNFIITKSKFNLSEIHLDIHSRGLSIEDYYLLHNGKIITSGSNVERGDIQIVLRAYGGKGGFGSMLRAIGAQIEKTTNREACRDLSGRRLRDINEEKRLKKWITQQAEREKEAADRKQKKLEKLCEEPKHEFRDNEYDKERSLLPEIVEDAVAQGLKKAGSTVAVKRKINERDDSKKKKRKLWIDDDVDDVSSSAEDESDGDDTKQSSLESSESNSCDTLINVNSQNKESEPKKSEEEKEHPNEISSTSEKNSDEETQIETYNTNTLQATI